MKLTIKTDDEGAQKHLAKVPDAVKSALRQEAEIVAKELLGSVKNKAGTLLGVHTGQYVASFANRIHESESGISTSTYTTSPLAHILEFGAHIPPHMIAAKTAHALHFSVGEAELFAHVVHSPGGEIAPHSVMHSTFLEKKDDIVREFVEAVQHVEATSR